VEEGPSEALFKKPVFGDELLTGAILGEVEYLEGLFFARLQNTWYDIANPDPRDELSLIIGADLIEWLRNADWWPRY